MKHKTHIVGALDKRGKKIVTVSTEGWYKTEDGCIYDNNGYEWFINKPNDDASKQRIEVDDLSGGVKTIRDFKVAVMQNSFLNPDKFIAHWKKTIEATMVETGWDYDDETKENPALTFGEAKDGFVHIRVRMKKKSWKNRENIYSGARQGESGIYDSKALKKVGALDSHIYGVVETERVAENILAKKK